MAETIISPGVLARENDQSQITSQPVEVGAAVIGPTVKGKVNIPKIITSYSEYVAEFGHGFESGSDEYSFLTSISAYNYFENGGSTLLVTRIASGSNTPATSSYIEANTGLIVGENTFTTNSFDIPGMTNPTASISASIDSTDGEGTGAEFLITFLDTSSIDTIEVLSSGSNFEDGEVLTIESSSLGATSSGGTDLELTISNDNIQSGGENIFELETLGDGQILNCSGPESPKGALSNGTKDNIRWEITNSNISDGTFTLLIRRGDDQTKRKSTLETFTNVSLDPKSSNYIARRVGNQTKTIQGSGTDVYIQTEGNYPNASKFVRVKQVNSKTPEYFTNDGEVKTQFTASIPVAQSGTMGGATGTIKDGAKFYNDINNTDTQGLNGDDYTTAIQLLNNPDEFRYKVITTPGLVLENEDHADSINTLLSNIEERGDAIYIPDLVNYGATPTSTVSTAASVDSSYAASYWPWVQITEPSTRQLVWIPASTLIPGVYASNDNAAEAWFAPAGINRGGLGMVNQAERKLTQPNRDTLYSGKVNPIATFPGRGVVVFGQKTLQTQASALDRVNVRRLLIELKSFISQIADTLVFEQNTESTRSQFLSQVNPFLESVEQRQGLFAYKVVMDDSNNTSDVIDRNQLIGAIYIQPTKTAEFIYLDFNITPTGAEFDA
jgi:phage tail sheath protein FI